MNKKNVLRRLSSLNNPKTDTYLESRSKSILESIIKSNNNDEIFELLDELEEFIYKVPTESLEVINIIIQDKKKLTPVITTTEFGDFQGKTHEELIFKCIDLLRKIRYINYEEVFNILVNLSLSNSETLKNRALEIIKQQVGYDLYALKNIGYLAQQKVLDIIKGWSEAERKKRIEVIKVVAEELLSPTYEGREMTDEKTLTFHSGSVNPTELLKSIRKDIISILLDLYPSIPDTSEKLKIIQVAHQATQLPHTSKYGDNVIEMITSDVETLLKFYEHILFDLKGNLTDNLAIVKDIFEKLFWLNKNFSKGTPEIITLLERIEKDKVYNLFVLFVGDAYRYRRYQGGDEFAAAEAERKKGVEQKLSEATPENTSEYINFLNNIAQYVGIIDEWQFTTLREFIQELGKEKPEVADIIFSDAFENNKPLKKHFLTNFMTGLRAGNHISIWDKYVKKILVEDTLESLSCIGYSVYYLDKTQLRPQDIEVIISLMERKKKITETEDENRRYHHSLSNGLYSVYKINPKEIEKLILKEIKGNPQYARMYTHDLEFKVLNGDINFEEWEEKNIKVLLQLLVDLPTLEYHDQTLLLHLGKIKFSYLTDVLLNRIKKSEKEKGDKQKFSRPYVHYDPIPYHINPELRDFIIEHPEYSSFVRTYISKMEASWTVFGWEISQLFQRLGGSVWDIIKEFIETGETDNLKRALRIIHSIDYADFDLCLEIIKQTDDKNIWGTVTAALSSTGVVGGEFGLAEAYAAKAEKAKEYLTDKNPRVKKFITKFIKNMQRQSEDERIHAEEGIKVRKLEFEE